MTDGSEPTGRSRAGRSSRRAFLGSAGAATIAGLAGCVFGSDEELPEVRMMAYGGFSDPGFRETLEEEVDAELDVGSSSSTRIREIWEDGDHEWDIATLDWLDAIRLIEADVLASVPGDRVHAGQQRDIFERLQDEALSAGGDAMALPVGGSWLGYGYDGRTFDDHDPSWSAPFSEEVEGVDLTEGVFMPTQPYWGIHGVAAHLGLTDAFDVDGVEFTDDQFESIRETATDQYPLVYDYRPDGGEDWTPLGDETEIGLVPIADVVAERAEGDEWPEYATPEGTPLVNGDAVVVSDATDVPEAAWEVADTFHHPRISASVSRFQDTIGVHPEIGEHIEEFVVDERFAQFLDPAVEFVQGLDDEDFDNLTLTGLSSDPDAWLDLWSEVVEGLPERDH